jgi:hypothetical protein
MTARQPVKIRSGVKPAKEVDLETLAKKKGTLADVLAEICREQLSGDPLGSDLTPQKVDVELRSGRPGEVTEQALRLSDDWRTKVLPVLQARENVEIGMAHHVTGG